MVTSDNNCKTPLGFYEKAIEELRFARTELQETQNNFIVTVQSLQTELELLKSQLQTTKEELAATKSELENCQLTIKTMNNEPKYYTEIIQELAEIKAQVSELSQLSNLSDSQALLDLKLQISQLTEELTLVSPISGIDYRNLQQLLSAQEWKEANQETTANLLKICGKQMWLDDNDVKNLPRVDLRIINNLWVKYSQGKFGFSVQKEIIDEFQDIKYFAKKLGWLTDVNNSYCVKYEDYNFSLNAPQGHLPATSCLLGLGVKDEKVPSHRLKRLQYFLSRY
ncbi:MAG TPA: GUN4 domain-containing protein [Nostocaceae cyanobacterium]|nr:GUN4 domain-containing protein [Nostocaceae cyanobacterium]